MLRLASSQRTIVMMISGQSFFLPDTSSHTGQWADFCRCFEFVRQQRQRNLYVAHKVRPLCTRQKTRFINDMYHVV